MTSDSDSRSTCCLLAAAVLLLLSGCGYIGEPLPPLLNIPAHADNLAAVQRGSTIIVHFTLPVLTTEGVVIRRPIRMDLRVDGKLVTGGSVSNGIAEYKIPAKDWIGKQVSIDVRIIGANGRDAGWWKPLLLTVVPPPEQPRDLVAEAAPQGVRLTWHAAGNAFVILRRGPDDKEFQAAGRTDKPEWIDTNVTFGKPYSYLVQSVVKTPDGEAQSELSTEASLTPVDTFPPPNPTGLTAVPSTASIELVWEALTIPDIVGYRIYRATAGGPFERIADTQQLPAYSDRRIEAGKSYRYTVSAVKKNGLESPPSSAVEVAAP